MSITSLTEHFQTLLRETACFSNLTANDLLQLRTCLSHAQTIVLRKNRSMPSSRRFLNWVDFLLNGDNLARHLQFIRTTVNALAKSGKQKADNILLSVYPIAAVYTCQQNQGRLDLKMNQSLICMEPVQIQEFARLLQSRKQPTLSRFIREIFYSRDAQKIHTFFIDRTSSVKSQENSKGQFFDLNALFNALNHSCFQGKLTRPAIRWSAKVNKTRMGSYRYQTDLITINRLLDQKGVPELVVRYVLYHEMLHKALGYRTKNGRIRTHTAQFRQMERAFPEYETAERYLRKLIAAQSAFRGS